MLLVECSSVEAEGILGFKIRELTGCRDARKFEQGFLYASFIAKDEREKTSHFLWGLNPVIRRDVHLTSASTFRAVVDNVLGAEHDEAEIRQWRSPQGASNRPWKKLNAAPTKKNQAAKPAKSKPKQVCPIHKREHFGTCMARD